MKNMNLTLGGVLSLLTLSTLISGCSANFNGTMTGAAPTAAVALGGKVMGGEQPILGAHIYLFAAGTTGYGSASTNLLSTCATASSPACSSPATLSDGDGYYVLTDNVGGGFTLTGTYTCPTNSSQVYLLSEGGNPGGGSTNSAAYLMAALGSCGNLTANTFITINELTTVAGVTALQQFISGPTAIGSNGGTPLGLQNAFSVANVLVNTNNGVPTATDANVTYPTNKIYTLGDAMAACVNSMGTGSTQCSNFLGGAVDENYPTTVPTNTFNAMFNIARYPAANPSKVFLAVGSMPIFGYALSSAPNDFSLPIAYHGQGLTPGQGQASAIAIDASGNAVIAVCGLSCDMSTTQHDAVVEIQPYGGMYGTGYVVSGAGYGIGSVHNTQSLALDPSSDVYTVDAAHTTGNMPYFANPSINLIAQGGSEFSNSPITDTTDFMMPEGIAIDTNPTAWITDPAASINSSAAGVYTVSYNGTVSFPLAYVTNTVGHAPRYTTATGIAFDYNGDVIISDNGTNTVKGGVAIFAPALGGPSGFAYSEIYTSQAAGDGAVGAAHPTAIAVDNTHKIWELDPSVRTLYKIDPNPADSPMTPYNINNALSVTGTTITGVSVQNFIIDGQNGLVVPVCSNTCNSANSVPDSLAFLGADGSLVTGRSGLQDASLSNPVSVAIDGSGNTWVANAGSGTVTEFVGISSPLVTPLSLALLNSSIATRP